MRQGTVIAAAITTGLLLTTTAYAESRSFELSGFDRIDIATGLDAVVKQGDAFSVSATSNSTQALDNLQIEADGGMLRARFDQSFLDFILSGGLVGMLLSSGNALTVEITVPELTGIDASSGADVRADGLTSPSLDLNASSGANIEVTNVTAGMLRLESSSGADIDVSGSADTTEANASSGADIDGEKLVTNKATANASSGGGLSLHVTASIRAEASSGGDIDIYGNPAERDVDTSSGGGVSFDD